MVKRKWPLPHKPVAWSRLVIDDDFAQFWAKFLRNDLYRYYCSLPEDLRAGTARIGPDVFDYQHEYDETGWRITRTIKTYVGMFIDNKTGKKSWLLKFPSTELKRCRCGRIGGPKMVRDRSAKTLITPDEIEEMREQQRARGFRPHVGLYDRMEYYHGPTCRPCRAVDILQERQTKRYVQHWFLINELNMEIKKHGNQQHGRPSRRTR